MESINNIEYDLVIIGGGPAGCILAYFAIQKNLSVLLIESRDRPWDPTYSVWIDEIPNELLNSVKNHGDPFEHSWERMLFKGNKNFKSYINRPYAFLNNDVWLTFMKDFITTSPNSKWIRCQADIASASRFSITVRDHKLHAKIAVVDATGRNCKYLKSPAQICYGMDFNNIQHNLPLNEGILMDYSVDFHEDGIEQPTFCYIFPTSSTSFFAEETILTTHQKFVSLEKLYNRLMKRMNLLYPYNPSSVVFREKARLQMNCDINCSDDEPYRFGLSGGMIHPFTGYLVGHLFKRVDVFLNDCISQRKPILGSSESSILRFVHRGGQRLILSLNYEEINRFFKSFFELSVQDQKNILSRGDVFPSLLSFLRFGFLIDWDMKLKLLRKVFLG